MYKVFPLDQSLDWNLELEDNFKDERDIYFTREFFELFKHADGGEPYLFYFQKGPHVVFYPFLKREINYHDLGGGGAHGELYDISTPYGYGGPIANTGDPDFILDFKESFENFCRENNIIAEFIRFHPLIQNQENFRSVYSVAFERKTIVVDLSKGEEVLWDNMYPKNRNMVRAAQKNDIKIEFDFQAREIDNFIAVYEASLKRLNAPKYYFFPHIFYYDLIEIFKEEIFLVKAIKDNILLGMSLFFKYADKMHYFLSGTEKIGYKYDINNLLLFEVARWGINNGFKQIHLGGGRTNSPDDSLFKFKKKYNKNGEIDFFITKKVHNEEVYADLKSAWEDRYNLKEESFFPVYRKCVLEQRT